MAQISKIDHIEYGGVVRIIAEDLLRGLVYILNNYEKGELWEYGSTGGYA